MIATGAAMFPIALGSGDTSGRDLRPDDVAGISDLYPDAGFNDRRGSISGRVTKNGRGVYGAHVVAFDIGSETPSVAGAWPPPLMTGTTSIREMITNPRPIASPADILE